MVKLISRRPRNGASPGHSGWTGEVIAIIAEDTDCLAGIATLTQDILNGRLDERAKPYILGSFLITVPKKNGSLHPIAIGEAFYKLAGLFGLAPLDENIRKSLPRWQLGAAVPGGAELGATAIQLLLEDTSLKYAGISCDLKNAFNSRSRTAILSALYACPQLKSIWKISHWAYSSPSPLWIRMEDGSINTVKSSQGVRQGDILAMLLFALSMSDPVNEALLATPTVIPIGYADDINGVGPPREVTKFRNELQRIFRRENIIFNADKDLFTYLHSDSSPLPRSVTAAVSPVVVAEGISKILGVPIGQDDELISKFCVKQVEKHKPFFDVLTHPLLSPQHAFLLLRLCGIPRMNYLARTVYPGRLSAATAVFDKLAMGAAANVANIKLSENDEARKTFSLPVS